MDLHYNINLTNEAGVSAPAVLRSSNEPTETPPKLQKAIAPNPCLGRGTIEIDGKTLIALYSVETSASERDEVDRKKHQLWLDSSNLKPGQILGKAIDGENKLYRFEST